MSSSAVENFTPGVKEWVLEAIGSEHPQDVAYLQRMAAMVQEILAEDRKMLTEDRGFLERLLAACPEVLLNQAWERAKDWRRPPPVQESLSLAPPRLTPESAASPFAPDPWYDDAYSVTRPVTPAEVIAFARRLIHQDAQRTRYFSSPEDIKTYFILQLGRLQCEIFAAVFLDGCNGLLAYKKLFEGTLDRCSVYPREVVKQALTVNAAGVIFGHNHPQGQPQPSRQDEAITTLLKTALDAVGVTILDHIVVAGGEAVSFAEQGLLDLRPHEHEDD